MLLASRLFLLLDIKILQFEKAKARHKRDNEPPMRDDR